MDKLNILWVNDNPEAAHNMVFMYAINSKLKEWWSDVEIIIWGPSALLVAKDESIQDKIKKALNSGVKVSACRACAENYNVDDTLSSLGIDVKYMGLPLTEKLKNNEKLITI